MSIPPDPFIAWFETLGKSDVARVGGKNASLGEMVQRLAPGGVRVPEGIATTAQAYRELFKRLGYSFEHETIPRNIAHYTGRSS